jgi:hypothetical protein
MKGSSITNSRERGTMNLWEPSSSLEAVNIVSALTHSFIPCIPDMVYSIHKYSRVYFWKMRSLKKNDNIII